jgi:hypothetical protein
MGGKELSEEDSRVPSSSLSFSETFRAATRAQTRSPGRARAEGSRKESQRGLLALEGYWCFWERKPAPQIFFVPSELILSHFPPKFGITQIPVLATQENVNPGIASLSLLLPRSQSPWGNRARDSPPLRVASAASPLGSSDLPGLCPSQLG